jgi:hypothetical protein
MSDVLTIETTTAFTARFKEVMAFVRSGATVELRDGQETFIFSRKPGESGFLGALAGQVATRAPTEQLFSAGDLWEADQ